MQLKQLIELRGDPFPAPLPLPADELIALLKIHGDVFETIDGKVRFVGEYSPPRISRVKRTIEEIIKPIAVRHSVWPVYHDSDYETAPYCTLYFPEIQIPELKCSIRCPQCRFTRLAVGTKLWPGQVRSSKPVLTVNGEFTIVQSKMVEKFNSELVGQRFRKFDKGGVYYHLLANHHLKELIIRPDESFGSCGTCKKCDHPLYDMFFGPLRYARSAESSDDIVFCEFVESCVFSPKAYRFLTGVGAECSRHNIILFEQEG